MNFERYVDLVDSAMREALDGAPDVTMVVQLDTEGLAQATWSRGGLLARIREVSPKVVSFSFGLTGDPEIEAEGATLELLTETNAELLGARELAVLFARP